MYAKRDKNGKITGVARWPMKGWESVAEDNPEVVAFMNPPEPEPVSPTLEERLTALETEIATLKGAS